MNDNNKLPAGLEARANKIAVKLAATAAIKQTGETLSIHTRELLAVITRLFPGAIAENLPFVEVNGSRTVTMWAVNSTGDEINDRAIGEYYAALYVAHSFYEGDGGYCLAAIVADMPRKLGAIEKAFLNRVGDFANNWLSAVSQIQGMEGVNNG